MKTILFLFTFIFLSTGLFAQKFIQEWWEPIPGITAHSEAKTIITTDDNQLLIAGPIQKNWDFGNMFFIKTDTAANKIWLTYAEEQFHHMAQCPYHLMTDIENNFVMIGTYPVVYSQGTYFTKLSPSGNLLNTTMNGGQYDYQGGYDVEQTIDSGFLVAAFKEIYGAGACLALRKLDNSGHFIWDTTFVDADNNFIPGVFYGMDKVDDSTFVLTGNRIYKKEVGGDEKDILFAKVRVYDDSVRFLNFVVYEGEYNDLGYDILTLPDNEGYVICGKGPNENNPGSEQGIIIRVDIEGNLMWRKTYARNINSFTSFLKIHLNADNDILVLAQTNGGSQDPTLLKYSLDGDVLQKKHFDELNNEPTYDFTIDQDGKIYILATTYHDMEIWASILKVKDICPVNNPDVSLENDQPVLGEEIVVHVDNTKDVWQYSLVLLKDSTVLGTYMGNNGTIDFTAAGLNNEDVSEGIVVSVIEPGVDCYKYSDTLFPQFIDGVDDNYQSSLQIIPNPAHDYITVTDTEHQFSSLAIYSLNGKLILEKSLLSTQYSINLSDLPEGIYLLSITYKNRNIIYRKIVIN